VWCSGGVSWIELEGKKGYRLGTHDRTTDRASGANHKNCIDKEKRKTRGQQE